MRVIPEEFEATRDDPFQQDLLNRKPHVDALCDVMRDIRGHAVVSIEGSWGSGKTAFVKMCSARLQQQEVQVVNFNAWQESYTKSPLMDLVSAIASKIGSTWPAQIRQKFIDVGWNIAKATSRGLIDRDSFRKASGLKFPEWEDTNSKLAEFESMLQRIGDDRIVVLIDELDRCRPDYALELIETVRNLFAVDGVVVLLAINRDELCHSIQSLYGDRFDTDRFLRRFVDLPYTLPPPSGKHLAQFARDILSAANFDSRIISFGKNQGDMSRMLGKIPAAANHNLRDLQQSIHSAAVAMTTMKFDVRAEYDARANGEKIVALIILRTLSKSAFQRLAYGDRDAFAAVAAMNRAITDDAATLENHSNRDRHHQMIEASLLAEVYDTLVERKGVADDLSKAHDTFIERYIAAFRRQFDGLPDEAGTVRAGWIRKRTADNAKKATGPCLEIEELVGIIDLIAYKTR